MDGLRIYLLAGLLAHKVVWEILKRGPKVARPPQPLRVRAVKAVKVAILLGILAQTLLPEVLPIAADPFLLRVCGALLFTAGLAIAVAARIQLGKNWSDIETAKIKTDHAVVSQGIYGYVRHPIYAGDLLLLIGLELALNSWLVVVAVLLVPVVFRQAVREEQALRNTLPGYELYCRRTKRFIPFVG